MNNSIIITCALLILLSVTICWIITSNFYKKRISELEKENSLLKNRESDNEKILQEVKLSFTQIAQESLKNQQEQLLNEHSNDLKHKMELFKVAELEPVNKILKEFKDSIDNYQKSHKDESLEIKNAISTAEKYARALTLNTNSKGEFGEEWLEQIFKFANLEENVHYTKQYVSENSKPDFVVKLPNDKSIIIDSKVILKNFIEYKQTEDEVFKKDFINDLNNCISLLSKKNYEEIEELNQPGFILMYIPIETCINMIYTDYDFRKVLELANSRNIFIVGTSSMLVTLRLVNQLWASQLQYDNVKNIITVGENLYNNIATHAKNLLNIQQIIEKASSGIKTEMNRFTARKNSSIFKEAEKLRDFGIGTKEVKAGKKIEENLIPEELLKDSNEEEIDSNLILN